MYKLRIGIPISHKEYDPHSGGSYSYTTQLIKEIDSFQFNEQLELVFIDMSGEGIPLTKTLISFHPFSNRTLIDSLRKACIELFKRLNFWPFSSFLKSLENIHSLKRNNNIKKELKKNKISLLFNITPGGNDFSFPFVTTHWDIGHRSTFMFPEFTDSYNSRASYYDKILPNALYILTESNAGRQELINYLGISANRIGVMPIFPGQIVFDTVPLDVQTSVLEKYKLATNQFLIYPAQFWPHKNHTVLIDAMEKLAPKYPNLKLLFTGSDKGNLQYLKKYVEERCLNEQIKFLGFVSDEELYTFYKNASALVMPTYLGPSNMPPLEAAYLNCPVILSNLEGHRELMGNYATYFNPSDSNELAAKIVEQLEGKKSETVPFQSKFSIANAMKELEFNLLKLIPIRKTWDN